MKKIMGFMVAFALMHSQIALSADQVLQRLFTFLNDRIAEKEVMQSDKKIDHVEPQIKPITDMAMHMGKGAGIAIASCIPLLIAGLCRPDQMEQLDGEFKAAALVMPAVSWIIKDLIVAGNVTASKCARNNQYRWQDVANAGAQAVGSSGAALLLIAVMRYNQG